MKQDLDSQAHILRRLVLITGVLTSLMFWSSLSDPINLPKMFLLTIFSSWIFGTAASKVFFTRPIKFSWGQWSVIAFMLGVMLAAFLTDVKFTAFFGASQRNDGAFSYIALAILAFSSMMTFGPNHVNQLRLAILILGGVLTFYGLIQWSGNEPFHWVLLYNPIVGTLGNPDFMSAILGACAIATLWFAFDKHKKLVRVSSFVFLLLEVFVVRKTGSFQGVMVLAIGFSILIVGKLWQWKSRIGMASLFLALVGAVPVFFGLLNKGPLAAHVYRSSLRNRIDYWHAALNMFKAHPLFGVGLDRFGDNYGQYAPQIQVVQGQGTNNAHNVILQLMATGGLVVILPYLFLIGVILYATFQGIRSKTGQTRLDIIGLFSIWFALFLDSLVSIDNLGVVVWFWISGGVLYSVARSRVSDFNPKVKVKGRNGEAKGGGTSNNSGYISPIVSLVACISMLLIMVPAWRSSAMFQELEAFNGVLTVTQYADKLNQVANAQPNNVQTLISVADQALKHSQFDLALSFTRRVNAIDGRSIDGINMTAYANEEMRRFAPAVPYRIRLLKLDPWNTKNMLQLIADYVQLKDLINARAIASRIATLYPNSADAKTAAALIKG